MSEISNSIFAFATAVVTVLLILCVGVPAEDPPNANKTSRIQGRIVNGFPAEPHQFPYAVWWKFGKGEIFCGGTFSELYGIQFVVTAAHCVWRGFPWKWSTIDRARVKMYFGALSVKNRTGVEIRRPAKIVYHENWDNPPTANDIALMFIQPGWEITITNNIRPLEIAPAAYKTPAAVTIMGWGARQIHQRSPEVMNYRQMRTYEANVCHYYAPRITTNQFCVLPDDPTNYGGTCSGDSGGPVVAYASHDLNKQYLVGLVSYHSPAEKCGICSVYTKISNYGRWISDQVMDFKKEKPIEGRSSHFEYIDK